VSNILANTPVYHFQTPHHVFETSLWAEMSCAARTVYSYLLHAANRRSKPAFLLSDEELTKGTKLSDKSLTAARKEIQQLGLVKCTRVRVGFNYEILDPSIGSSLEKVEDFDTVSESVLRGFFTSHLKGREVFPEIGGIRSRCPFCNGTKPTLVMQLSKGGRWICESKRCRKHGKLVEFEIQTAAVNGEPPITSTQAHHRARQTLIRAMRSTEERKQQEIEHAISTTV
jgi:hypothetical protein